MSKIKLLAIGGNKMARETKKNQNKNQKNNESDIEKEYTLNSIGEKLDETMLMLEQANIAGYVELLNNRKRLFRSSLLSGIARGVGIGIGFLVFTTVLIYILQALGALNLPIIGDFIAEIVKIVQAQLNMDSAIR